MPLEAIPDDARRFGCLRTHRGRDLGLAEPDRVLGAHNGDEAVRLAQAIGLLTASSRRP